MSRLSQGQQKSLIVLASPLAKHLRGEFYRRVGVAVAAMDAPIGDGEFYRVASRLQREMLDVPCLAPLCMSVKQHSEGRWGFGHDRLPVATGSPQPLRIPNRE